MMKRIISLILVVVMLVLSLGSCGYSFAEDDLSAYATFSDTTKAAFTEALQNLLIENGEFSVDSETRKQMVVENIYKDFASIAKDEDAKLEGTPSKYDLVKYCYYVTADFDGTVAVLNADKMNVSSATKLQLGLTYGDDKVNSAIATALAALDFKDKAYTSSTSGKAEAGNVVYVTYTYSYNVTDAEGVTTEKNGTYTNERIVVAAAPAEGATATSLASYLAGKSIATSLDQVKINEEGKGEVTYTNIKINWVAKGEAITSFKDVTYKEEKKVTDTTGQSRDLNGKELTYYIYPVSYTPVAEYTPFNIVDLLMGASVTADMLYNVILGEEYAYLDEKEDKDKIEERATLLMNYKTADGKTLEAVAAALVELYDALENTSTGTQKAIENAESAKSKAQTAVTEAKDKVTAESNKETPDAAKLEELNKALEEANKVLEKAEQDLEQAKQLNQTKLDEKKALINSLFAITVDGETVETKIERGYRAATYKYLQDAYNTEIKMNLAKEIYYFLVTNADTSVNVTGTPEDAVDLTYEQLIENYKHEFYKEEHSDKVSNYSKYKGSFKNFLVAAVTEDIKTVKTYKEALAAVRERAAEYVKPLVAIYYAADVYGVTVTDKEFKEYKKDSDGNYLYASSYGENTARHAYQFDKLMDYFLEYEETTEADGEYEKITFSYKNVKYDFGTPASETVTEAE